jgi:hypothetical protein
MKTACYLIEKEKTPELEGSFESEKCKKTTYNRTFSWKF